jgi:SNF2 family DNA or RNA helicase
MGKTIQTMALMILNPPTNEDRKKRTTLVVCPSSLILQWKEELSSKTRPNTFKVLVHHERTKVKKHEEFSNYDGWYQQGRVGTDSI